MMDQRQRRHDRTTPTLPPPPQIECREGKVFFEDLGSTNGSFLNGAPLEERDPHALSTGDRLKLGATVMEVELRPQSVDGGEGSQ